MHKQTLRYCHQVEVHKFGSHLLQAGLCAYTRQSHRPLLRCSASCIGLGNWLAVSEHVGTKKPDQCQQHYYQTYIDPDSCPLPTIAPELRGVSWVAGSQACTLDIVLTLNTCQGALQFIQHAAASSHPNNNQRRLTLESGRTTG